MKISDIEKYNMEYIGDNKWRRYLPNKKGTKIYTIKEKCVFCNKQYLTLISNPSTFCSSSCVKRGKPPWNAGKSGYRLSKTTREKMKRSAKRGCDHHNWKNGITTTNEKIRKSRAYIHWCETVFERDNHTCQVCGQVGGELNAHHLESYGDNPKLRTKLSNGATTCKNCHNDFHHQYGYGNNTKEQFEEFKRKRLKRII